MCQQMGISRKAFYRYFSGKDGALEALLEHTLLEFGSFCIQREGDVLTPEKYLEDFFCFWLSKRALLGALEKSKLQGLLIRKALEFAQQESSLASRFLPGDIQFMEIQVARFCIGGIMSMVFSWHHEGYQQSPQQMAGVAMRLLTKPLISEERMLIF